MDGLDRNTAGYGCADQRGGRRLLDWRLGRGRVLRLIDVLCLLGDRVGEREPRDRAAVDQDLAEPLAADPLLRE